MVVRVNAAGRERVEDAVAVEAPLEIRIEGQPLAVTLRTPGHDRELALGFLHGEGAIRNASDVAGTAFTQARCSDEPDVLDLTLAPGLAFDWTRLERRFTATSACGLCGRAHLESLRAGLEAMRPAPLDAASWFDLSQRLREHQTAFLATGGMHAAVYLDASLAPLHVREDVGRHNATDKVVGVLLDHGALPAERGALWVSGRAGAEIVIKVARARIPVLASVGAPTSLAVDLARAAGLTLVGFLRDGRFSVYAGVDAMLE